MHIGVLTTSYPRFPGDPAGNFVAGLNRYLVRCGHTVEVLAAGDGPDERMAPIEVRRVASRLFYGGGAPDALAAGWSSYVEAGRFSLRMLRLLRWRAAGFQALISHWVLPSGLLVAVGAPRCRHLMIAHSSDIHLLRRLRAEALLRALRRRADLVYTASSLQVPGAPGRVVPMGVDAAEFAGIGAAERQTARLRLGLSRPTALFLGRLVPVKGLGVLLRVLGTEGVPADLLIAGDGPERARLSGMAAGLSLGDRVRFLGEVHGAARRELLAACDVVVLPSVLLPDGRTEGAPTVLLEALCAGCPVVASAVGGVAELVGDAGLVVPPGDQARLGAALREATAPGWRERLGSRAAARGARYDWSMVGPLVLGDLLRCGAKN